MRETQSYKELIILGSHALKKSGIDNSYNESLILMSYSAKLQKEQVISKINDKVSTKIKFKFINYIDRRSKFEPIAYISGYKEFWSLNFQVSKATLIPRNDSEILVETVLKYCCKTQTLNILDLGTGSGCLLLSILHQLPLATGTGIDLSRKALNIAKKNAKNLNLSSRVNFINLNWTKTTKHPFDIVISNPPYIKTSEISELQKDVQFEPHTALDGGKDGLDCYREIISLIPTLTKQKSWCFFEIGYGQSKSICALLEESGFKIITIEKDLSQIPRVIVFTPN